MSDIITRTYGNEVPDDMPINMLGLKVYGRTEQNGTPTPDSPIPLVSPGDDGNIAVSVTGGNLLDYEKWKTRTPINCSSYEFRDNGISMTASESGDAQTDWMDSSSLSIPCIPGNKYIIAWEYSGAPGIVYVFPNGTTDGMQYTEAGTHILSYVPEPGVNFFRFRVGVTEAKATGAYKNIRICVGEDAGFEPYKPIQYITIPTPNGLPGIKVDSGGNYTDSTGQQWITDEVDFARGVYVKRINSIVYNGSETEYWYCDGGRGANTFYRIETLKPFNRYGEKLAVCSHFPVKPRSQYNKDVTDTLILSSGTTINFTKVSVASNTSEWRAWLSKNPVTVYYILAAPIEIPLSKETLRAYANLRINKPTTVIINDAGADMELGQQASLSKKVFLHEQTSEPSGPVGSHASLTVHCPNGSTVKVEKDGVVYTDTPAASSGEMTSSKFNNITHGIWTVTISNATDTATKNINIVTDYELTMNFWAATINVTYPAGSACTITDRHSRFTAPNETGSWSCIVPNAGNWTVTATNGKQTETTTVSVTEEGSSKEVVLEYFAATVNVTYPKGSTCSMSDGTTTLRAPNADGYWSCTVPNAGTWTVTCTNGMRTLREDVLISERGQNESLTLAYFEATIAIAYPTGSICTATDGKTTLRAPDTSGVWSCVVPNTGTWTITAVDGGQTKSKTVSITSNGQSEAVSIVFFAATINVTYPVGAICSCSNEATIFSASDTSGSWSFVVPRPGNWTIKAHSSTQSESKVVSITTDLQVEEVTIKFFASTINITYPAGASCTATNGNTKFTAPDTSGIWTLVVPRTGVWTVEAVKGNRKDSDTVEITEDGQTKSLSLRFFASYINVKYPSGSFKVTVWYIDSYGTKQEVGTDTSGSGQCRIIVAQTGKYEIGAYRVIPYVGIESVAGDYSSATVQISADDQTVNIELVYNTLPEFSYTGTYKILDDNGSPITQTHGNWNIHLLTSGVFRFTKLNGAKNGIDVFCCGGGGRGGECSMVVLDRSPTDWYYIGGGGGGGGGYRENSFGIMVNESTPFEIRIGGAGGTTSGFGLSASGGTNGANGDTQEAHGGAGGTGGSNGGRGAQGGAAVKGEDGMCAFLEPTGIKYGAGGGGGYGWNQDNQIYGKAASGGRDGGGASGQNGAANSGGGGGGAIAVSTTSYGSPGSGGSGIVIIRNTR